MLWCFELWNSLSYGVSSYGILCVMVFRVMDFPLYIYCQFLFFKTFLMCLFLQFEEKIVFLDFPKQSTNITIYLSICPCICHFVCASVLTLEPLQLAQ